MSVNNYHIILSNVTKDKMNWDFASVMDFGRDDSDAHIIIPWQTMERIVVTPSQNNGLSDSHVVNLFCSYDLADWDTKAIAIAIAQRVEQMVKSDIVIKESPNVV